MSSRLVNERFWIDPYTANLDPIEKLMFLYLLTNPATNLVGIYELDVRRMAFETGIDKDMITKLLERFQADGKIEYHKGWVIVCKWAKYQNFNSPQVKAGYERILKELPEYLVKYLCSIDTIYIPYADGVDTQSYFTLLNSTSLNFTKTIPNGENAGKDGFSETKESKAESNGEASANGWIPVEAFEKWYKFYPRAGHKPTCRTAFIGKITSEKQYQQLLKATRNYKSEVEDRDLKFIKYPLTFLDVYNEHLK